MNRDIRIRSGSLLNFSKHPIKFGEQIYPTSEHLFQALKAVKASDHEWVRQASSASVAKKRGRQVKLRKDWEEVKFPIMVAVLILKMTQHSDVREELMETGSAYLVEYRDDDEWGRKNGKGKNMMGEALGLVRTMFNTWR